MNTLWYETMYRVHVLTAYHDDVHLHRWETWKLVLDELDPIVEPFKAEIAMRSRWAIVGQNKWLPFGRMKWRSDHHRRWTTRYKDTARFFDTEAISPHWNRIGDGAESLRFYLRVTSKTVPRRASKPQSYRQLLIVAVPLGAETPPESELARALCRVAALDGLRLRYVVHDLPWAERANPSGSMMKKCLQDMNIFPQGTVVLDMSGVDR